MSGQFWLAHEQVEPLRSHYPKAWGKPRVDDQRALSGILFALKNGFSRQDAPAAYGLHKTLYDRFARWSQQGKFARIFHELAQPGRDGGTLITDIEPVVRHGFEDRRRGHLKVHRTAANSRRRGTSAAVVRTTSGLNSKLHTVSDGHGRPLTFFLSPGQMSDVKGALVLLAEMLMVKRLIGDKGYRAIVRVAPESWSPKTCSRTPMRQPLLTSRGSAGREAV